MNIQTLRVNQSIVAVFVRGKFYACFQNSTPFLEVVNQIKREFV